MSDINGQPYQFLLYLPFGETMAEQNVAGWATPYQFNAKELDENTGLYYYGARYYDPRISVWHGVDPLADMYPSWSPYTYTMNNPITYWDPTGMSTENGGEGKDPTYVSKGPEVTITAKRIGSNYDQSSERYGYNGDWKAYQKDFNLQGWDYDSYNSYYNSVHREDFDASVKRQDKEEAARIATEKLMYWYGIVFPAVTITMAPSAGRGFFRTSPAKFKFSSPVAAKGGMTGKETAISLSEQGFANGATSQLTMANGKFFVGVSSGVKPFQLTDEMTGILMNAGRTGSRPVPSWFGGCAEVSAIQQARAAGYNWSQIRSATLKAYNIGTGSPKPFCTGCLNMLNKIP